MTRPHDTYNYKVPHWAACAISNGYENLTNEEKRQLDTFLDSLPGDSKGTFDFGTEEPEFSYTNDVNGLGDDVYQATYTVFTD